MRFRRLREHDVEVFLLHGPATLEDMLYHFYRADIEEMIKIGVATAHKAKFQREIERRKMAIANVISTARMGDDFDPINAKFVRTYHGLLKVFWATYKCPSCFHDKQFHITDKANADPRATTDWFCTQCDGLCGAKIDDLGESKCAQ